MNTVDIALPCYKYGHFLYDCVQNILNQEGVQVRVLILDDASPDNAQEVAKRLMAEDPRVEYRRHAENLGHVATFNEGIEWSSADFMMVLSADDLLTPGSLKRSVELMNAHPEVVMTHGSFIRTADPSRHSVVIPAEYPTRIMSGPRFWEASCRAVGNIVCVPTVLVRTAVQKELGPYRVDLPFTHDMEMWLRFASRGSIGFIDTCQAFYRVHGKNLTVQFMGAVGFLQLWEAFEVLFSSYGRDFANREELRARVRRDLSWNAFWSASEHFDRGDVTGSAQCRDLAVRLWPEIRNSPAWRRLRLKQAMGAGLWRTVRPLADRLRRQPSPALAAHS